MGKLERLLWRSILACWRGNFDGAKTQKEPVERAQCSRWSCRIYDAGGTLIPTSMHIIQTAEPCFRNCPTNDPVYDELNPWKSVWYLYYTDRVPLTKLDTGIEGKMRERYF